MLVAKAEWGTKRICMNCGARFYDMQRDPIVCPSCGATYDPELAAKPRRSRPAAAAAPVKAAAAAAVLADEDSRGATYVDLRLPERPAAGELPATREDDSGQISTSP